MSLNKFLLEGTFHDPGRKEIHPENLRIKKKLKESRITQQTVSKITGIPVRKIRESLNSSLPPPEWLRQELISIIRRHAYSGKDLMDMY